MSCSLHLRHSLVYRTFGALLVLFISGFKRRKMDKFLLGRKNITIIAFDKPISETFPPISGLKTWFPSIH